tara:strand:- start:228 stop:503 length:276 start_codon:yes stop_codon:yes gene_type:complete
LITLEQINKGRSIFLQMGLTVIESPQDYFNNYKRVGAIVCYPSVKNCKSFWLDIEFFNEYRLKILFKKHKQVPYQFFIKQVDNFYRVGWKI